MGKYYNVGKKSDMKRFQRNIEKKMNAIVKDGEASIKKQMENLIKEENSHNLFYEGPERPFMYKPSGESSPNYFRKIRCPKCFLVTGIKSGISQCAWCGCHIEVTENTQFIE